MKRSMQIVFSCCLVRVYQDLPSHMAVTITFFLAKEGLKQGHGHPSELLSFNNSNFSPRPLYAMITRIPSFLRAFTATSLLRRFHAESKVNVIPEANYNVVFDIDGVLIKVCSYEYLLVA